MPTIHSAELIHRGRESGGWQWPLVGAVAVNSGVTDVPDVRRARRKK
jgi:hypothetical protein